MRRILIVLGAGVLLCTPAAAFTLQEHTVYLRLTLITTSEKPDVNYFEEQPDIPTCEKELHRFLSVESPNLPGIKAVMGACIKPVEPAINAKSTHIAPVPGVRPTRVEPKRNSVR